MLLSASRRQARAASQEHDAILLTVAAPPADAEQLAAVAGELLARLGMQVVLRRVARLELAELRQPLARDSGYFARVWVSFGENGKARLYLEHAARDRVLVRDVADDAEILELVREELATFCRPRSRD